MLVNLGKAVEFAMLVSDVVYDLFLFQFPKMCNQIIFSCLGGILLQQTVIIGNSVAQSNIAFNWP